jgi:hypothetical protein
MIVHKAVGVAEPVVAFVVEGQNFEKRLSILAVFEYGFLSLPRLVL